MLYHRLLSFIHPIYNSLYLLILLIPAAAAATSFQSCPTLCDPIDGSPPGSSVPGILQAGILEWVAISFSSAWKWKVKVKSFSRVQLFATPWTAAHQAPLSMGFPRQEYWSGVSLPSPANPKLPIYPSPLVTMVCSLCLSLLLSPVNQWSHSVVPSLCKPMDCSLPGSSIHGIFQARVLEWDTISFSRGSSRSRDQTQVSCLQADALQSELPICSFVSYFEFHI